MQLAMKLGLEFREGFFKNRYVGRTFIMPGQSVRRKSVRQKLNALPTEFKGKNVLLVDDSIVRGTTSREIVHMARGAGANRVIFASAAPPVRFPNVYGIDMPTRDELIAHGRSDEEIQRMIEADGLVYQDIACDEILGIRSRAASDELRGQLLRRPLHHRRRDARIPGPPRSQPYRGQHRRRRTARPAEPQSGLGRLTGHRMGAASALVYNSCIAPI